MRFARPFPRPVARTDFARRGGAVAVVAGVAVFIAASVTASGAGADLATPKRHAHAPVTHELIWQAPVTAAPKPSAAPAGPNARKSVRRKPTAADGIAPVDHGVISALASNGIPAVALNAYRVAAARMAHAEPSCGIPWYLLAGIGREESDHGRFAGAQLHADGVSTPKIIGPALDGKHWDYIPAPADGVALDGDARYAHALGPMQFIPSTWASWGADANGDGRADIFNIDDAALGAARYLCAAGGDLTKRAGRVTAVLAYNHNSQYLAQVLALARAYALSVQVTGTPKGNTTGKLPKAHKGGYLPPVNPGAPTANGGAKSAPANPTHPKSAPPTKGVPAPSTSSRPKPSTTGSGSSSTCTSRTATPTATPTATSTRSGTKSKSSAAPVAPAAVSAAAASATKSSASPRPSTTGTKTCVA